MGREVRRVPLDFDHPLREVWSGYLRPDELDLPACPDCLGRGYTAAGLWLESITTLILMLGEDAAQRQLDRGLHPYLANLENRPYIQRPNGTFLTPRPSADAAELSTGLAGRAPDHFGFGHDAVDRWSAKKAIIAAAGLPETWGTCQTCGGEGEVATAEQRAAHEAWEPTEPPTGDGWQLWETTTEGSPTSPVFATGEELAQWMSVNPCGFAGAVIPLETARRWVESDGWSPSLMYSPATGLQDGITATGGAR